MLLARGGEAAVLIGGFISYVYSNVGMGLPAFGLRPYSQLACWLDTLVPNYLVPAHSVRVCSEQTRAQARAVHMRNVQACTRCTRAMEAFLQLLLPHMNFNTAIGIT